MRRDLDQLDREVLEEQLRERDRHREPRGPYRRPSPRSRSVEAEILDRGIAAIDEPDTAQADTAHRFVASTEPGYEHTCAVEGCGALLGDEEHTGSDGVLVTADSITDDQIRELLSEAESHAYPGADPKWAKQWDAAELALSSAAGPSVRTGARARCAEFINARRVKETAARRQQPYVSVRQSPLGWVLEVWDPELPSGHQVVRSERPLSKPTPAQKRQALASYERTLNEETRP